MLKRVFLSIQLPFADYRNFIPQRPYSVLRPAWPKPSHNEFVRRFGPVRSRDFLNSVGNQKLHLAHTQSSERFYVNANSLIKMSKYKLSRGTSVLGVQPCYLRLLADGQALFRIEVGILVDIKKNALKTGRAFDNIIDAVTREAMFQYRTNESKSRNSVNLSKLSADLRRKYFHATEKHPEDKSLPPSSFDGGLVRPLDWSVIAVLPNAPSYTWLQTSVSGPRVARSPNAPNISVGLRRSPEGYNRMFASTCLVVAPHNRNSQQLARHLRLGLLRSRAELLSLWSVVSECRQHGKLYQAASPKCQFDEAISLRRYLISALNRVLDTVNDHDAKDVLLSALASEGILDPAKIVMLRSHCSHILDAGMIQRTESTLRTVNIFSTGGAASINLGNQNIDRSVNQMSNDSYNFHDKVTAGAIGKNASAENFLNGTPNDTDFEKLIAELDKLSTAAAIKKDTDQKAADAEKNISNAREAADKKDTSGVVSFLRASGEWIAETSQKIAVPVAVAILKGKYGG